MIMDRQMQTVDIVYFSPTHSSEKIAKAIASGIGVPRRRVIDLTLDRSGSDIKIADGDFVILCAPVYAGRVAPVAVERLRRLKIEGKNKAVVAVVYGNRDYDDALVELYDIAVDIGLEPVAAGVFVGEHSYSRPDMPVAAGRPDALDVDEAKRLGKICLEKWMSGAVSGDLHIKGNRPYREVKHSEPVAPVSTGDCAGCGECVGVCPTGAISQADNGAIVTDAANCIKCCACVKVCPIGARKFDTPFTAYLHQNFSVRREPELFV